MVKPLGKYTPFECALYEFILTLYYSKETYSDQFQIVGGPLTGEN